MKNIKKILVLGQGELCPKCNIYMERREHNFNKDSVKSKISNMTYFFTQWDYCPNCNHVQHYERYKKYNNTTKGQIGSFLEEQGNLFKNL